MAFFVSILATNCATVKKVEEMVHKDTGPKRKVMLIGISNRTGYPMEGYLPHLEELLLTRVQKADHLLLVGAKTPPGAAAKEAGSMEEGILSSARQDGVSILLKGDISEFETRHKLKGLYGLRKEKPIMHMYFRLEAFDVETGTMLYSGYRKGELTVGGDFNEREYLQQHKTPPPELADSAINDLVEEAAESLENVPWKGFVTEVADGRVSFGAGNDVGLKAGDRLEARGRSEKVVNFAGAAYLPPGNKTGTIRIETVGETSSTGMIEEGSAVQRGDTLVLVKE
jgi:hypothetical protein